jgi:hypothetical protein
VADEGFQGIEERFPQADGDVLSRALDDAPMESPSAAASLTARSRSLEPPASTRRP